MEKAKPKSTTIYLVDDDGGFAVADGPRARQYTDALLALGWRKVQKEEYERAEALAEWRDKTAAKAGRLLD